MTTTFTVEIDWARSGTWVDETSRVQRVATWAGFERPDEAMAAVGRAEIVLDNADRRYSPHYSASPLAGLVAPRRPIRVRACAGAQVWTLFYGFIQRIEPEIGILGDRSVRLEAVDGLGLLARQPISPAHAASIAVDDAITTLVNQAITPPALAISDNGDGLTHFGRAWLPEVTSCQDALRDVCQAVHGRFWQARDGTLTYWTREQRQQGTGTPALAVSETAPPDGLMAVQDAAGVINRVQVTVYPPDVTGALTEIWRAQTALRLAPGTTRTVRVPFRDTNGRRIAALDVATLAPGTDFQINTWRDGRGRDWTGSSAVSVSMSVEATRAAITLTNASGRTLYATLLRVRGRPIRTYDPVMIQRDDASSQSEYGVRCLALDLPMQGEPTFAEGLAAYVLYRTRLPVLVAERIVARNRDAIGDANLFGVEIMDLVDVSDGQSSLNQVRHRVRAVSYRLDSTGIATELYLERADDEPYWLLEVAGAGELDESTTLAF